MRIIAGRLKGRRLAAPRWRGLRPTSDKLRETLFNILAPRLAGARLLDGYAGTGAVGIEALSRGALEVTFVERDPRAVALIEANLARCGIATGYAIIREDFVRAARSGRAGAGYSLVFLDPPYELRDLDAVVAAAAAVVGPGGLVVLERAARRAPAAPRGALVHVRTLVAGDSALDFYRRAEESGADEAGGV
jgi:16S rRNA (guanine966-N2)-methyltransferase